MSQSIHSELSYSILNIKREVEIDMGDFSKDVQKFVKNKTGKNVSEQTINKLAKGVSSETLQSEAQLRNLISQLSKAANVPVSKSTTNEIIQAVKRSGGNMSTLESLIKSLMKK